MNIVINIKCFVKYPLKRFLLLELIEGQKTNIIYKLSR